MILLLFIFFDSKYGATFSLLFFLFSFFSVLTDTVFPRGLPYAYRTARRSFVVQIWQVHFFLFTYGRPFPRITDSCYLL